MKWTIGIITDGHQDNRILEIIDSIAWQIPIENYEIIIVGNSKINRRDVRVIPFDESLKEAPWITRKKNIICQEAKFENICLLHDYFIFADNWYQSFCEFGEYWDVCIPRIKQQNGGRLHCWVLCDPWRVKEVLDFSDTKDVHIRMYCSGGFYCVKKAFALKNPLDENLLWAQEEDVEWSKRVRPFWNYRINTGTWVRAIKNKML